jgi:hypothetical protein
VPIYHLVPVAPLLRDRAWIASAHQGPCCVCSPSEALARRFAGEAFREPVPGAARQAAVAAATPWSERRLVGARELASPEDVEPPPLGTIFVPADPDRPDGAFVALGRL